MKKSALVSYATALVARNLNAGLYSLDDCVAFCLASLLTHPLTDFRAYMEADAVPKGRDLKMLRTALRYGRLQWLRKENACHSYRSRKLMRALRNFESRAEMRIAN